MPLAPLLAALAMATFAADPPPGNRVDLPSGARLFIPEAAAPREGRLELWLHLHGAPSVVEPAFASLGRNAVLVTFNRPGLSSVYAGPFSDPTLFPKLLDETMAAAAERPGGKPLRPGRVILSSFSAGFGGVREILKQPAAFDRVDALVLADSLYCGYQGDPANKRLGDDLMSGFRRFAREAAKGRKSMLVSHSAQIPTGYGSTTETADDLLAATGLVADSVAIDRGGGWRETRHASGGFLAIVGFAGEGPEDHMLHLRRIGELWGRLPGPTTPAPDDRP